MSGVPAIRRRPDIFLLGQAGKVARAMPVPACCIARADFRNPTNPESEFAMQ